MPSKSSHFARSDGFLCKQEVTGSNPGGSIPPPLFGWRWPSVGIDFADVLSSKLPVFIAIVVMLAAAMLVVVFRSLVILRKAAVMNVLSIVAAVGVTVAVFQHGWLGGLLGGSPGPIEPCSQ